MKRFTNTHGEYLLDENGVLYINGKEKFRNVKDVSYQASRRDTYLYILFEKNFYRIYSLKQRKTILTDISKILYKSKSIFIVKFLKQSNETTEKCYLFDLNDDSKCRYILNNVGQFILELDGITLTNVKRGKPPIILPEKCKDLCEPKETIDFFAITESNEILILMPYQYENLKSYDTSTLHFWKFKKYVKYKTLRNLLYRELIDLISFKNEDDKNMFALTSILHIYNSDKNNSNIVQVENKKTALTDKHIKLRYGKLNVTLTFDKIFFEEMGKTTEYDYNIFEFSDAYLQNLISYYNVRQIENKIKYFASKKTTVTKILNTPEFLDKKNLLRRYLFGLNCNPNSDIFYIITNQNQLVMVNRIKFAEVIKNALIANKSFKKLLTRYDLEAYTIKMLIKKISLDEYNKLRQQHVFIK